jgi:hypothetical protein
MIKVNIRESFYSFVFVILMIININKISFRFLILQFYYFYFQMRAVLKQLVAEQYFVLDNLFYKKIT